MPLCMKPTALFATAPCCCLVVGELETASGGFTAAVQQLCNVATLPGEHWARGYPNSLAGWLCSRHTGITGPLVLPWSEAARHAHACAFLKTPPCAASATPCKALWVPPLACQTFTAGTALPSATWRLLTWTPMAWCRLEAWASTSTVSGWGSGKVACMAADGLHRNAASYGLTRVTVGMPGCMGAYHGIP